ncbi:MAG: lyase family protein, partial [Actinomycetales bacterium]
LQWGGAAGTMAAVTLLAGNAGSAGAGAAAGAGPGAGAGENDGGALALAADLASRLGLADPVAPWQTNRLPVTGLGQALADVLAAAGKVANDVLLLSRPELGEVSEPAAAGRGVSSAMPQKQNPVLSVLIRSAALAAPGYQAQLQAAAGAAVDERPDGSWHVEWQALRQLLRLAGGAAAKLAELAAGLTVHPDRMRAAMELSGPLLVSEKIMAVVAPLLEGDTPGSGKEKVQALIRQAQQQEPQQAQQQEPAQVQQSGGRGPGAADPLAVLLRDAVPREALSDADLADLLDPAGYLGASDQLITRIVGAYQDWSAA